MRVQVYAEQFYSYDNKYVDTSEKIEVYINYIICIYYTKPRISSWNNFEGLM